MKFSPKQTILAGATIATLGLGLATGVGMASAATSSSGSSLVDKISSTFNLDKSKVQAVFDADRSEHQAQMKADQASRLAAAVKAGTITQAQSDYITNAQGEIEALMQKTEPGQEDDATRQSIHAKIEALRTWAQQNNVDESLIGPGGHGGPGGPGMNGGPGSSSSGASTSSSN